MSQTITLRVSDEAVKQAREIAARSNQQVEDVLSEWIDRMVMDPPMESLPDDQVLALANQQLDPEQQKELSELLSDNREGTLDEALRVRLDEMMRAYRRGLVRKAQALQVAVARGLVAPPS